MRLGHFVDTCIMKNFSPICIIRIILLHGKLPELVIPGEKPQ